MAIGILNLSWTARGRVIRETPEQIYGGYANARGEISLFGEVIAYRLNSKFNTVRQGAPLNSGAQARYDAVEPGETFQYCSATFQRLSDAQILDICSSGTFRLRSI